MTTEPTDRKAQILEAALALAFEGGSARVTTVAIAERLGLTQPAIYRHNRSKADLWTAITDRLGRDIARKLDIVATSDQPALARLRALVLGQLALVEHTPALPEIMLTRDPTRADAVALPFGARLAEVSVEQGRFLRAGEVAAVLDGTDKAEIEAQVPVADLRRLLRLAAPEATAFAADPTAMPSVLRGLDIGAEVRLDLGDDRLRWSGRVDRVSDTIDPKTGTPGVIVVVDAAYDSAGPDAQPPLTKGMFVEVSIAGHPVTGLAVPRSALWDGMLLVAGEGDRLERHQVSITLT